MEILDIKIEYFFGLLSLITLTFGLLLTTTTPTVPIVVMAYVLLLVSVIFLHQKVK